MRHMNDRCCKQGHIGCGLARLLMMLSLLSGCRLSIGSERMAQKQGEEWTVDGKKINIASTFYERGERGAIIYVVQYRCFEEKDLFGLNDNSAFELARPIFGYVYRNRTYERTQFWPVRGTEPPPIRVAVELLPLREGHGGTYRVLLSTGELGWRLNQPPATGAP